MENSRRLTILSIINTIMHMMVAIVLFNLWNFAINSPMPVQIRLHMAFSATGYLLLLVEGISSLNKNINTWTTYLSRQNTKIVHLVLNAIGGICVLTGFIIIVNLKVRHFESAHGIMGLIAFICCMLSALNGTIAYLGPKLGDRVRITPVKFGHTVVGCITIIMGLSTLCVGIYKTVFTSFNNGTGLSLALTIMIAFIMIHVIIGPIINAKLHLSNMRTTTL